MALRHIWKASLLTAVLLLAPIASADESNNPEDGAKSQETGSEEGPCSVIIIDYEAPFIDPHPECIEKFPDGQLLSFSRR